MFSLPCKEAFERIHHVVTESVEGATSTNEISNTLAVAVLVHLTSGFIVKTKRAFPAETTTLTISKVFIDVLFDSPVTPTKGTTFNKLSGDVLLSQKTNVINDKRGLPCLMYHVALSNTTPQSQEVVAEMVLLDRSLS